MKPTPTSSPFSFQPQAFLFTNVAGEVIFADRSFLRLKKRPATRAVLSDPLHSMLGIDEPSPARLMRDLKRFGSVDYRALSYQSDTGSLYPAWAAGVAVYTERESYLGADVVISPEPPEGAAARALKSHSDVLQSYTRQAFMQAKLLKTGTFLQVYTTLCIEAILILLTRIGGPEMRTTLERIINEVARTHAIPASMEYGYLEFVGRTAHFDAYLTLLRAGTKYAIDAIGKRIVGRELQMIDRHIDPGLLELITQLDMRSGLDQ